MDLQTVASLTGLSIRKVRYVVDHRLLPGLRTAGQPNALGRARNLTDLEGFAVACAAVLLECGVKKEAVIEVMDILAENVPGGVSTPSRCRRRTAIEAAFDRTVTPAELRYADGANVLFRLGASETGWLQPRTWAPLAKEYQPRVVISIDLARLRSQFQPGLGTVLSRRHRPSRPY